MTYDDAHYMRHCLALAERALAQGEVPVGAAVVRGGRILGEGLEATRSLYDPVAHAEVRAIQAACSTERATMLEGGTLYTTVEPCVLCGYVVRSVRLSRVVFGAPAGRLGACRSAYALLPDASITDWGPPPAIVQVLSDECTALLERHRVARRWQH